MKTETIINELEYIHSNLKGPKSNDALEGFGRLNWLIEQLKKEVAIAAAPAKLCENCGEPTKPCPHKGIFYGISIADCSAWQPISAPVAEVCAHSFDDGRCDLLSNRLPNEYPEKPKYGVCARLGCKKFTPRKQAQVEPDHTEGIRKLILIAVEHEKRIAALEGEGK